MSRLHRATAAALLAALVSLASLGAGTVVAQSAAPEQPWPTGDALRGQLQEIGFIFRIDGATGDWQGFAPPAVAGDAPALELDGAGTQSALASFDLELIGGDPSLALTALLEVATRLPLDRGDIDRARRFVVDDLLEAAPETLESCYVTDWDRGVARVTVDVEATTARIELAEFSGALEALADAECAPLIPEEVAAQLGDPSTERLTIEISGDPPAFEPSDISVEGALVTLVLTVRNDSDTERSVTFEAPLDASTGPIEPGGVKLIVVRQLEPGEYAFFGGTGTDGPRGTLRVEPPTAD